MRLSAGAGPPAAALQLHDALRQLAALRRRPGGHLTPREPRLRIVTRAGIVYDVRLDQLLRIEAYHSGRAPTRVLLADGFTVQLVERRPRSEKTVFAELYTPADFPAASDE